MPTDKKSTARVAEAGRLLVQIDADPEIICVGREWPAIANYVWRHKSRFQALYGTKLIDVIYYFKVIR